MVVQDNHKTFKNRFGLRRLRCKITEYKSAKKMLKFEIGNLASIFDSMADGVYIADRDYNIQYINPVLREQFGPVEGRKCYEYFHDRQQVCPWCKNQEVFDGKTIRWEWYSPKNKRTYDLVDTPLRNPDGTISKLEIFRDITDYKKTEESLRTSEKKYRDLVETMNEGLGVADENYNFTYVNSKFAGMLGYSYDEMVGHNLLEFLDEENKKLMEKQIAERKAGKAKPFDLVWTAKDGRKVYTIASPKGIFDEQGNFKGSLGVLTDITKRKNAEAEIIRAKEQWERTFDAVPDLIAIVDNQFRILRANKALADKLEMTPVELIGKTCYEHIHLTNEPPDFCPHTKVITDRREQTQEIFDKRLGGHFILTISPLFDEQKHFIGSVHIARDITKNKMIEEALRKSEDRYRRVVEDQTEFIVRWLPDGTRTFVNDSYCRYFGIKHDKAIGSNLFPVIYEDDRESVQKKIESLTIKNPVLTDEHRVIRADGSIGWNQWTDRAVFDEKGKVIELQSVGRDITERVQAEEGLYLRDRAICNATNGIVITSHKSAFDNPIVYANPAFEKITGYALSEVLEHDCTFLQREDKNQPELEQIRQALEKGDDCKVVVRNYRKNGTMFWNELSISPVRDREGRITNHIGIMTDITERKKATEVLERTQFSVDRARDLVFWVDQNARFLYVNKAACQTLGYSKDELLNMTVLDIDATYTWEMWLEHWEQLRRKKSFTIESKHRTKNGRIFPVEISVNHIVFGENEFNHAFARDITERKQSEEALKHSEERYALAQRAADIGSWDWNILTGELIWSEQIEPLFGFGRGEFGATYEAFLECVHPEDRQYVINSVNACIGEGKEYAIEHRIVRPDGTVRWVSETGDVIRDETGKAVRMLGIVQDITVRKEADEALRRSEEFNKRIIESSNDCIKVLDLDGRLLFMSDGGQKLMDITDIRPYLNKFWTDFWKGEDKKAACKAIAKAKKGKAGTFLGYSETAKGTPKWWHIIITPISSENGTVECLLAVSRDVTERKRAEEEIRKLNQQLEQRVIERTTELSKANKQLQQQIEQRIKLEKEILAISERVQREIGRELHDSIGQQLTGIGFLAKVLERKLSQKSPAEVADLKEIGNLVNQATSQARSLSKGLQPIDLVSGSFISSLDELAANTENLFGVHCTFKYDKPVKIDESEKAIHLYRITQEALTNAIKHGRAKNVEIELARKENKCILTIKNDGLDFQEEDTAKGTGMGLHIMKHRVDIIGGTLDIRKAPEGGTLVTCIFPNKNKD